MGKLFAVTVIVLAAADTGFGGINWNTILLAVIGLAGTIYAARANATAKEASDNTKKVEQVLGEVKTEVKDVKVEVNSKTSNMVAEIKELRRELSDKTVRLATLDEKQRGQEIAAATAVVPPDPRLETALKDIGILKASSAKPGQ